MEHLILAMQQADCPSVIRNRCPTTQLRRAYLTGQSDDMYHGRGECVPQCTDCTAYYLASCIKQVYLFC